jgi:ketosteroid isomerase-like protein
MKSAFLFRLVLCAAWPLRPGQDRSKAGPDESRLLALESAWNLAEENKDINALDQLLSDTLAYTDFDGTFMNKAQFLTSVKNSTPNSDQITNDDVTVHLYGASAIVTGSYREKGIVKGKPVLRRGRFTDSWVNQNGTWLCVASQSTLISHSQD